MNNLNLTIDFIRDDHEQIINKLSQLGNEDKDKMVNLTFRFDGSKDLDQINEMFRNEGLNLVETYYICDYCNKESKDRINLNTVKCDKCSKVFDYCKNIHSNMNNECPFCNN
jgi:ribosomal protein L37AE/L43A